MARSEGEGVAGYDGLSQRNQRAEPLRDCGGKVLKSYERESARFADYLQMHELLI